MSTICVLKLKMNNEYDEEEIESLSREWSFSIQSSLNVISDEDEEIPTTTFLIIKWLIDWLNWLIDIVYEVRLWIFEIIKKPVWYFYRKSIHLFAAVYYCCFKGNDILLCFV